MLYLEEVELWFWSPEVCKVCSGVNSLSVLHVSFSDVMDPNLLLDFPSETINSF